MKRRRERALAQAAATSSLKVPSKPKQKQQNTTDGESAEQSAFSSTGHGNKKNN